MSNRKITGVLEQFASRLFGGRLQIVLIAGFSLVAALTVGLGAAAISRVISDYLTAAENERVARDMDLANAFYQLKLTEVAAISHRLVLEPLVLQSIPEAFYGQIGAINTIDQLITNKIMVLALGGTHLIALLDSQGNILVGRVLSADGELLPVISQGNWAELPIVKDSLSTGETLSATEIIPVEFLAQVGLDDQAHIDLIETPKAALELFDPRESTAGLALIGVSPIKDENGEIAGAVLTAHLVNNDFTLVDRIKAVAGIDTATIFFGDLRVSTNVLNNNGTRAVGTRVSQEVYDIVLDQGRDYVGDAFVVNETYISRYEPLLDHLDHVVGILYVGAREADFLELGDALRSRITLIALLSILLAGIIAIPTARFITRPIAAQVAAIQRLAQGDMTVRVPVAGKGELSVLAHSFNSMVETLQKTQQELLHKEKLASMGQLAAGVAHEINNPLGTIMLFADVMYNEADRDDPRRKDLEMIINETTRCKNIVGSLLNFARQQKVMVQDTDVDAILDQAIVEVEHQPSFDGIEINREFSADLPVIQADPEQLIQIFVNLLNNAAEAISGEGTITIATQPIGHQWVEINISDTGIGIPEEYLDKLFTPFFTTKPPGKGTGLGLSIVYGIVKMHRGQIITQSEVGKGSTFTIILPVQLITDQQVSENNQHGLV
ncbi:MAG: cache domain-containing protein [Anaerolineales bacterium]|nr:cache domain-containing protein [Anaerolineales bacterium]